MKPHIVDFLKFLESKENKKAPIEAKLLYPNKFSPLTKEELYIDGDLDLSSTNIKSLPDNLIVHGDLVLGYTDIESLPNNLQVVGDLDLSSTLIQFLPDNLKVGGILFVAGTSFADEDDGMTDEEIRQEIERKGGYVKGDIYND
jgi:hypothetical protein